MELPDPDKKVEVVFGFEATKYGGDDEVSQDVHVQRRETLRAYTAHGHVPHSARNVGLGKGVGAQLTKTALGGAAYEVLGPLERSRQTRFEFSASTLRNHKITCLPPNAEAAMLPKKASTCLRPQTTPAALRDGEVPSMFRQLLLCEQDWPTEQLRCEELRIVREHRWTFLGALELAERGRDFCLFVRCLLDLQRDVQLNAEHSTLDPNLLRSCTYFVKRQCSRKKSGDVYQLLTHFICNAVVFDEWDHYLKEAFESHRSQEDSFLVPYLDEVWGRFCRFVDVVEEIFKIVNIRVVQMSLSLPPVRDLLHEHMRRRCFSRDVVTRNRLFVQEKASHNTIKDIKRTLGLHT